MNKPCLGGYGESCRKNNACTYPNCMEKKQTAVEWLAIQLYEKMNISGDGNVLQEIYDQAKAIEKEQMQNCFKAGHKLRWQGILIKYSELNKGFEDYYNKTFNQ